MEKRSQTWLEKNVLSLKGKSILVTGANSGIGFEASRDFADRGAHVYLACRSEAKGLAAEAAIRHDVPEASMDLVLYDQGDLKSIALLGEKTAGIFLDAIVLNAGIYMPKKEDENASLPPLTFKTNGLGTYAVFKALFPHHKESRYVFVGSVNNRPPKAHDFRNSMIPSASRDRAYGVSKRAVMTAFAYALDQGAEAYLTHPGVSRTNILNSYAPGMKKLGNGFLYLVVHKPWKAALGIVLAATTSAPRGSYITPRGLFHLSGYPKLARLPRRKCFADLSNLRTTFDDYLASHPTGL